MLRRRPRRSDCNSCERVERSESDTALLSLLRPLQPVATVPTAKTLPHRWAWVTHHLSTKYIQTHGEMALESPRKQGSRVSPFSFNLTLIMSLPIRLDFFFHFARTTARHIYWTELFPHPSVNAQHLTTYEPKRAFHTHIDFRPDTSESKDAHIYFFLFRTPLTCGSPQCERVQQAAKISWLVML